MRITKINTETGDKEEKQTLSKLINECSDEYTEKRTVYYITFQKYLKKQICGIRAFKKTDCRLTIINLKCGSLITEYKLVLGVHGSDPRGISTGHAGDVIKDEIENGSLGEFTVDKFNSTFNENIPINVYVIITMKKYTWYDFCKIEELFREKIAERSYDMEGQKLETTDIFIVNGEMNCATPDTTKEGIDVWLVALGSDAVTIQIGNDLKDLLDSGQLRKLGHLFEDR
ncbi:Hypothetical predicted protein, partial [Paramuricea clavata]